MDWALAVAPFPFSKCSVQNGPERSRARRFCAAKRTLDGEDRFWKIGMKGKGAGSQGYPPRVGAAPQFHRIRLCPLETRNSHTFFRRVPEISGPLKKYALLLLWIQPHGPEHSVVESY